MTDTIYSHSVRILTCESCGAPLQAAPEGGSFRCSYCGVTQIVSRRVEIPGGRASGPAISESERHARLRAQEQLAEPMPPSVGELLVAGELPLDRVDAARSMWTETRVQLAKMASFPLAERLFHLTVVLAPRLPERDRRAILETAVELLPDEGHAHVFRCMLAQLAAFAGDDRAAAEWLSEADPRPTELRMDTAYRAAAAALAAARDEPAGILPLLGMAPGDVPLASAGATTCFYLRIHALERTGREERSRAELFERVRRMGLPSVRDELAELGALRLCAASLAWIEAELAAEARRRALSDAERAVTDAEAALAQHERRSLTMFVPVALIIAVVATAMVAIPWTVVVTGGLEKDPLFGAHAKLLCPVICEGCTGPYEFAHWSGQFGHRYSAIYCQRPAGDGTLERGSGISSGTTQITLSMIPCCSPVGALAAVAFMLRLRSVARVRRRRLRQRLEEDRRRYAELQRRSR